MGVMLELIIPSHRNNYLASAHSRMLLNPNPANAVAVAPSSSQSSYTPTQRKKKGPVEPACRCRISMLQLLHLEPLQISVRSCHPSLSTI
jgi:hypothetical protein